MNTLGGSLVANLRDAASINDSLGKGTVYAHRSCCKLSIAFLLIHVC